MDKTNQSGNSVEFPSKKGQSVSRRNLLKTGSAVVAGTAIGSNAITGFPTIWAQNIKNVTLRQFGTGVSNINEIAKRAKQDLGITLQMTALDTDSTAQRVVTQPRSFDIADIEYFTLKKVWGSGNMQPMDIRKLKYYDQIVGTFKNGKLTRDRQTGTRWFRPFITPTRWVFDRT